MKKQYSSKIPLFNRRDFLKLSLLASASTLTWACRASLGRLLADGDEDILVVGAGVSGLAAARELSSLGYRVTVIEGRDRIGGRVWTDRSWGFAIDLGASWIEGESGNPIAELRDDFGITTFETDFDNVSTYDFDGRKLNTLELTEIGLEYQSLLSEVYAYAEERDSDTSYAEAINAVLAGEDLTDFEQRALDYMAAALVAESAEDLSGLSLWYTGEDGEFGGESVLFPGGYDQIAHGLAEGLDIRLGEVVKRIQYDNSGVTIETGNNTFSGDRAIITLPLGVLKSGKVKFSPALPASKTNAISRLGMGTLNKVALQFPEVFWPKNAHFLGYLAENDIPLKGFLNLSVSSGKPVLVAFAGGSKARALESLSRDEIIEQAMYGLRAAFGEEIPDPIDIIATRWTKDPFVFGSYSHVPPGASFDDYDAIAEPAGDRLFFAGEGTHREYPATVHGAFLSGIREAERIAYEI